MDHARYAELFRIESREHLAELDTALLALEAGVGAAGIGALSTPARDAHVATVFRGTHTIKGMAAAMGYTTVERIAHAMESLLDAARRDALTLDAALVALLLDGTDVLAQTVRDVDDAADERAHAGPGDRESPAVRALLARLHAAATPTAHDVAAIGDLAPLVPLALVGFGQATAGDDVGPAPAARHARTVQVRLTADCPLKGVRALLVTGRLAAMGEVGTTVPPQERWHDDTFDGVFTVSVLSTVGDDALADAARAAGDVARVVIAAVETSGAPMSASATDADGVPLPEGSASGAARDQIRHVRIDLRRLDTLLDLMGELVITRDRLMRVAEGVVEQGGDRAVLKVAQETARLVSALQDEVLQARMVPVGQVFDRFPRLVRDVARELGKDVQFVTEGREIELDRSLLDAIGDPIVHLLRNALDHGIESAESRHAAGKPPTARLVLRAARDRASVVVQVEDDGRGIDRGAVMRRAVERGLVPAGDAPLDDDRLLQVLASSGLSTARTVTAISGRGVGVDVVATRVRALGGTLSLETIAGVGTVFTMRLPATLAITRALLVQVAGDTYALPAAHVVEALEYDSAMRTTTDSGEALRLRDEILPVVRLRQRFGCPPGDGESFIAVVEVAGRRSALLVDALVAQQDVVVKPFHTVRGSARWFNGATVLGDGTPSLIVDLGSLT